MEHSKEKNILSSIFNKNVFIHYGNGKSQTDLLKYGWIALCKGTPYNCCKFLAPCGVILQCDTQPCIHTLLKIARIKNMQ